MLILGEPWARSGWRSKSVERRWRQAEALVCAGGVIAVGTEIVDETGRHTMISSGRVTISRAVGHFLNKFALARMRLLLSRRTVPISAIEPE